MAEHGKPAVAETADGCGDFGGFGDQRAGRAVDGFEVAAQRLRIAAVAGKVEGRGDIAVAGEGEGEGLHEPPGPGEAMRNDDDGAERPGKRAVDGRRRAGDVHRANVDARIVPVQAEERDDDRERR